MRITSLYFVKRISSLRITMKFGLAFSLMVSILIMETIIGYRALSVIRDSSNVIMSNAEMQRLAFGMSNHWESTQRLRYTYFLDSTEIGVEKAYEIYALPAGSKISEVIRDGAAIKRYLSTKGISESQPKIEIDLNRFLSDVSQYATVFEEAHQLQLELFSNDGLIAQLQEQAEDLSSILPDSPSGSDLWTDYYQIRYLESRDLLKPQHPSTTELNLLASRFSQSFEGSDLPVDQKIAALSLLQEYQRLAGEIQNAKLNLADRRQTLDFLNQSIEPVMIELLLLVDTEVGIASLQIEDTRQATVQLLTGGIVVGLLVAMFIGVLLHYTVTRNVIHLTHTATQFQEGNLEARARIESKDELGDLANTFNAMAEEVETLTAELREQANRDPLTGLFNRRYLDDILPRELERAARTGNPISMVMIDLDNFKEINDEHGHAVGDRILVEFGKVLASRSRLGDLACRFGGDEFVVLLPGARSEDAVTCISHWTQILATVQVISRGEKIVTSFSAGIVQWTPGEKPQELFARADAALYHAKNAGRNNHFLDSHTPQKDFNKTS